MTDFPVAVVGCGAFGQNHLRVVSQSADSRLAYAVDQDGGRAQQAASQYGCEALTDWRELTTGPRVRAAVVASPTTTHGEIAAGLLEAGIDVLVEKPICADLASAQRLCDIARANGRVLAVGHLERMNPAVVALRKLVTVPLFFEVHRMSLFAPRSLDVDVVLDLMIHDVDIILSLVGAMPEEVRAAGIRILSGKVDIANVRLAFPGGCVANLTASRVSTEKVRKLRLFQPHQYISADYTRQDGVVISVNDQQEIDFVPLPTVKQEPLAAQWAAFRDRALGGDAAVVDGQEASRALGVCLDILDKIEMHTGIVNQTLAERGIAGPRG